MVKMSDFDERRTILLDLWEAIDAQDVRKVKSILGRNFLDLNQSIEPHDMTLLHLAVGHECADIVKILLDHNSDPNAKAGDAGLTSLHLSVNCQNVQIFKLLLEAGGDPQLEDESGLSCINLIKEDMDVDLRDAFMEAMVREEKIIPGSASAADATPTVTVPKPPIVSGPSRIPAACEDRLSPAASTKSHSSATSMTTSGNSTFYSCVSSNTEKENVVPSSAQIQIESLSTNLSRCKISEMPMPVPRFSSPSFSCSTSEGISDQTTNPLMSDVTCSILAPPPQLTKSVATATLPILIENPGDSYHDSSQSSSTRTGPHCTSSADCSCCSSVAPTPVLSETQLKTVRATAAAHGLPVLPSTISVLSKFVNTQTSTVMLSPSKTSSGYSTELEYLIRDMDLINQWQGLQVEFLQNFTTPKRSSKSFFNYLLLDPYSVKRTNFSGNHLKTGLLQNPEKFQVFLKSVFYVGKGSGNRPLQHLVDAKNRLTSKETQRLPADKLDKILSIWKKGQGILVLSLFHHSPEVEVNANEAAMIDTIGLGSSELTNIKKGSYLNTPAVNWSQKTKNQFGAYLLHKAYCSFVVSGSKLFYPKDV